MCFVGPPPPVRLSSRCYPGEEVTQGTGRAGDYLVHAAGCGCGGDSAAASAVVTSKSTVG